MASRVLPVRSAPPSRNAIVIAAGLVTVLVFGPTFKATIRLGLQDDRYLQVVVAPLACALLLSLHRNDIFSRATLSPQLGILLLPAPLLLGTFFRFLSPAGEAAPQPLAALAMVVWWIAAFAMCSGLETVRAALYPLCCLFLMIPPPATWMERAAPSSSTDRRLSPSAYYKPRACRSCGMGCSSRSQAWILKWLPNVAASIRAWRSSWLPSSQAISVFAPDGAAWSYSSSPSRSLSSRMPPASSRSPRYRFGWIAPSSTARSIIDMAAQSSRPSLLCSSCWYWPDCKGWNEVGRLDRRIR